jgi:hypothetical protein
VLPVSHRAGSRSSVAEGACRPRRARLLSRAACACHRVARGIPGSYRRTFWGPWSSLRALRVPSRLHRQQHRPDVGPSAGESPVGKLLQHGGERAQLCLLAWAVCANRDQAPAGHEKLAGVENVRDIRAVVERRVHVLVVDVAGQLDGDVLVPSSSNASHTSTIACARNLYSSSRETNLPGSGLSISYNA